MNTLFDATEQQLLQELARGNELAVSRVYRQQFPIVSRWLQGRGASEADAADVFQEGMVILFQKAGDPGFRLSCQIGTFLIGICKRLWLRRVDQLSRRPASLDEHLTAEDLAYEETLDIHEEREAHYSQLEDALTHLGEPCQSILRAYYHQDKSMAQIATDFGYTNPENAKTQKYKCLQRLKKIFFGAGSR